MHVGALHLLAPPPGDARAYVAAVRRHVAGRLHLSPVFTRRLAPMPFALANPVWVRADAVDLRAHVRHVRLPAPGSSRSWKRRSRGCTRGCSSATARSGGCT